MAKGEVGVVGLGIMGGAFAQNLRAAGWRVTGYDVDPARRRALARAGIEIAPDAKALAAFCPPQAKKVSPTRFEWQAKDFTPKADLSVIFYTFQEPE